MFRITYRKKLLEATKAHVDVIRLIFSRKKQRQIENQ